LDDVHVTAFEFIKRGEPLLHVYDAIMTYKSKTKPFVSITEHH